jgi:5-bromo-4-chloroindolyl phosphate hydrolysis protein
MVRLKNFTDDSITNLTSKRGSLAVQSVRYKDNLMSLSDFTSAYYNLNRKIDSALSTINEHKMYEITDLTL